MALMWRCDLCNAEYGRPIWRALVWSDGINQSVEDPVTLKKVRKQAMPDAKCDVCDVCVGTLAEKMRRRGDPGNVGGGASGNRGSAPKCCTCGRDSKAIVRLVPNGKEAWHAYEYTGTFCWRHVKPFKKWARGVRKYRERRQELVIVKNLAEAGD